MGASVCGQCHPAQLAAWREGPHALAYRSLETHQRRDPHCRACHDDAGVSEQLRRAFMFKRVKARVARGVDCESCHGLGGDILDANGSHIKQRTRVSDPALQNQNRPKLTQSSLKTSDDPLDLSTPMCARCHQLTPITKTLHQLYPKLKRGDLGRFKHGLTL